MAKGNQDDPVVDVGEAYSKTESYIEENKKSITFIIGAIILLFGGYYGYRQFYLKPQEHEATRQMWKAEYYYEIDSLKKAINGDDAGFYGFKGIADKYSGTKSADLANYYLATSYLQLGQYNKAIEHAEEVELENQIVAPLTQGVIGDAYVEQGKLKEAVSYFETATEISKNDFTTPLYLKKAGLVLEDLQRFEEALNKYERIKNDYPESSQGTDIEKYIGRAESYVE